MTEDEKLTEIKTTLTDKLYEHITDVDHLDAIEVGAIVDIIKDVEEALYYCHKIKCMEKECEEKV